MSADFWSEFEGGRPSGFQRTATGGVWVDDPKRTIADGSRARRVQYGRPSSAGKQIENSYALQKWSERMVLIGAVRLFMDGELLPSDIDAVIHYDEADADSKKALDEIVVRCKERARALVASVLGTYRHQLTEFTDEDRDPIELLSEGVDLGIPEIESEAIMAAWAELVDEFFDVLYVEQAVVDDEHRMAGTTDRVVRLKRDITLRIEHEPGSITLPAGLVCTLDLKTGQLRTETKKERIIYWHTYAPQIAAYSLGRPYEFEPERRVRWSRRPSAEHAIIAHLQVVEGRVEIRLVYVNVRAGRDALRLVRAAKSFFARRDVIGLADEPVIVREVGA